METDTRIVALSNALNEVRHICPDVSHIFVFNENNQILAKDQNVTEDAISCTQATFNSLIKRANPLGKIETVTVQGARARVNILCVNDLYLATTTSNDADEKIVTNLTKIMVPTLLKLVQGIESPSVQVTESHSVQSIEKFSPVQVETNTFEPESEPESEPEPILNPKLHLPDIQVSRLTVENLHGIGGLLSSPEIARIDSMMIAQWNESYGTNEVQEITIENPATGKRLRCHFQPIKETKFEGKEIIQLSEKIMQLLQIKKGTQIIVKPVTKFIHDDYTPNNGGLDLSIEKSAAPHKFESSSNTDISYPDAQFSQLIVENVVGIRGFLAGPDVVRIDTLLIEQWKEIFGDKKIDEVTIEDTVTGKQLRCNFIPLKDEKFRAKSVIQMSEKIQQALRTKKGALVKVKPVIA